MALLDDVKQEQLDRLVNESYEQFENGQINESIKTLLEAWELFPEPKTKYDESYHLAKYLSETYLSAGNTVMALEWANTLKECDLEREDDGDREFVLGKVYYEMSDMPRAKELFEIANRKSYGYVFEDEDLKYKNLLIT